LQSLAQLALSRTREYDADLNAASLTGDPEGLANALVKIESLQGGWLERIVCRDAVFQIPPCCAVTPVPGIESSG